MKKLLMGGLLLQAALGAAAAECGDAACRSWYDEARLSLGLAGAGAHGYVDLQGSARITQNGAGAVKTERYGGKACLPAKQKPWWLLFFPLGS